MSNERMWGGECETRRERGAWYLTLHLPSWIIEDVAACIARGDVITLDGRGLGDIVLRVEPPQDKKA